MSVQLSATCGFSIRSFTGLELVLFSRWSELILPTEYSLRIATLSKFDH